MATQEEINELMGATQAGNTQGTNIQLEGFSQLKKAKTPLTLDE